MDNAMFESNMELVISDYISTHYYKVKKNYLHISSL